MGEGDVALDRFELGLPGIALGRGLALLRTNGGRRGEQGHGQPQHRPSFA